MTQSSPLFLKLLVKKKIILGKRYMKRKPKILLTGLGFGSNLFLVQLIF